MFPNSNPEYWIRKKANRKTGYPFATIAYYGPTDELATKKVKSAHSAYFGQTGIAGQVM